MAEDAKPAVQFFQGVAGILTAGMVTVAYSGRKATPFGRWPRWPGNDAAAD